MKYKKRNLQVPLNKTILKRRTSSQNPISQETRSKIVSKREKRGNTIEGRQMQNIFHTKKGRIIQKKSHNNIKQLKSDWILPDKSFNTADSSLHMPQSSATAAPGDTRLQHMQQPYATAASTDKRLQHMQLSHATATPTDATVFCYRCFY